MSDEPVSVGILDTGLAGVALARREFRAAEETPWPPPSVDGHGSRLASIVLARCPSARLYDARALVQGRPGSAARVAIALDWLAECGVDVVNMSIGLRHDREVLADAVDRASRAGCLLIASAPASGAAVFPAAYGQVLAVTGDARCDAGVFADLDGSGVDFGAAPGGPSHRAHSRGAGASFACAHVSGALAQLLAEGCRSADAPEALRRRCRFRGRECPR